MFRRTWYGSVMKLDVCTNDCFAFAGHSLCPCTRGAAALATTVNITLWLHPDGSMRSHVFWTQTDVYVPRHNGIQQAWPHPSANAYVPEPNT